MRAQVDAGMWVGNHTLTHPDLTELEQAGAGGRRSPARRPSSAAITGEAPTLFRPPLMVTSKAIRAEAERATT